MLYISSMTPHFYCCFLQQQREEIYNSLDIHYAVMHTISSNNMVSLGRQLMYLCVCVTAHKIFRFKKEHLLDTKPTLCTCDCCSYHVRTPSTYVNWFYRLFELIKLPWYLLIFAEWTRLYTSTFQILHMYVHPFYGGVYLIEVNVPVANIIAAAIKNSYKKLAKKHF